MIQDLCVIMLTAGIVSLLFKLFKQPVVLGYIVAGLMVGPYVLGESWISEVEGVETWGQIGVLFLLFSMGLEFSFKKLLKMGSTAVVAAMVIVIGMMSSGYLIGQLLGWSSMTSLFLGGMLCMSSTTIVFKAIEDMGLSKHHFVNVCFGILVIEDLFAVVLMVLLSSIAVSSSFEGKELAGEILKLVFYLVLWFVGGIMILPSFLKRFRKHLNDETMTIFSIGLCLGMVMLAMKAGFSSALGAFVMGSLLAETLEAERVERLVKPIKDIFGAIFFVSVGMMIDPAMLVTHWLPILLITITVIVGQIIFASTGTLLSGQSLRVSLQTGFSLVQIGEFAFIIATLGQSLHVTDDFLYPIVVAVSVITTFLTPYIMRLSIPSLHFIERHSSDGFKMWLENYSKVRNSTAAESLWKTYLKRMLVTVFVNGVVTIFLFIIYFTYIHPYFESFIGDGSNTVTVLGLRWPEFGIKALSCALILGATAPLIFNIAIKHINSSEVKQLWSTGSIQKAFLTGIFIVRLLLSMAFVFFVITNIFSFNAGFIIVLSFIVVIAIAFSQSIRKRSRRLEHAFQQNFTARETSAEQRRAMRNSTVKSLLNYDIHISEFDVSADSDFCGKKLKNLSIRSVSGVSIVCIVRSGLHIFIPGGDESIYPGDRIIAAGSDYQIDAFQKMLDQSISETKTNQAPAMVSLEHFTVSESDNIHGKTIIESRIRENAHCIIMGVERNGEYYMNPNPKMTIEVGDTLILAGETSTLKAFVNA
ncbi:MAG: cation:proton antiporter [Bacteroidaceae bacterium]|nr:cation:proton antiporter [Bacteroidaceae bacterium]